MTDKINVIDLGSSSVRYMRISNGKILFKRSEVTRLAQGMSDGLLCEESTKRTLRAISEFCNEAKAFGGDIYIFATAAVRNAKNGKIFACLVKDLTGVEMQILSGEEEAEIGLLGALKGLDGALIDIGGGSTEIVVAKDKKIIYEKSLQVGAVNLKDEAGSLITAKDIISKRLAFFGQVPQSNFYGVGGTVTSLTAILLGLREYDSAKVHGFILTREELNRGVEILKNNSAEQIAQKYCVNLKRAEVLSYGVTILQGLFDLIGLEKITVSESDNLEGFLIKTKGVKYER